MHFLLQLKLHLSCSKNFQTTPADPIHLYTAAQKSALCINEVLKGRGWLLFVNKFFFCFLKESELLFDILFFKGHKLIWLKLISDWERMRTCHFPYQSVRKAQGTAIMSQGIWPDPLLVNLTSCWCSTYLLLLTCNFCIMSDNFQHRL